MIFFDLRSDYYVFGPEQLCWCCRGTGWETHQICAICDGWGDSDVFLSVKDFERAKQDAILRKLTHGRTADIELNSPNFRPKAADEFAARGFERINRFAPTDREWKAGQFSGSEIH